MHSQLRSAANRRESSQGSPIDLSLYRNNQSTAKMMTRSTSTTNANPSFRPICIIPPVGNPSTHTIYSNAVPSSSSSSMSSSCASSQTSTCTINHERASKCKTMNHTRKFSKEISFRNFSSTFIVDA